MDAGRQTLALVPRRNSCSLSLCTSALRVVPGPASGLTLAIGGDNLTKMRMELHTRSVSDEESSCISTSLLSVSRKWDFMTTPVWKRRCVSSGTSDVGSCSAEDKAFSSGGTFRSGQLNNGEQLRCVFTVRRKCDFRRVSERPGTWQWVPVACGRF